MTVKIMQIFDYAKCMPIYFTRLNSSFHYPTRNSLTKQRRNKAPKRVTKEVPPIGGTSGRKRLLAYLNKSAKDNRCNNRPRNKTLGFGMLVALEILKPQHHAEAKVHGKVQYLINISHLIERSFGRIEERKKQNHPHNKYR